LEKSIEVPYKRINFGKLLEFVDDVVETLKAGMKSIESIKSVNEGTGADRQLAVFEKTKTLNDVGRILF